MPKISIIIPTYNSSLFIKRTIKSVLGQTFTDWELLIIDDCSTDNTVELIKEFAKNDKRIKLFKTPHNSGGPATPKNIGIENAQGEYVAFLDHDDEWLPQKLEKQLRVFEASADKNLGFVSCFFYIKNNKNNKIVLKYNKFYKENIIEKLAINNFIITSSCILAKLSIIKGVGLFDRNFKTLDDWDMWLKTLQAGYSLDFVPEYLLNYFIHDKNAYFRDDGSNEKREFIVFYEKHKELFLKYSYFKVGYYYFALKNYKLSRKYYIHFLLSQRSNFMKKVKSLVYIMFTFFPKLEEILKKTRTRFIYD